MAGSRPTGKARHRRPQQQQNGITLTTTTVSVATKTTPQVHSTRRKKHRKMTEVLKSNSIGSTQPQQITSVEPKSTEAHQSNDSNQQGITSTEQNFTESHKSNEIDSEQQGIMSMVATTTIASIGQQWEVQYARFFISPPISSFEDTRHPSLVPPVKKSKGSWISSFTSLASLRLLTSTTDYSDTSRSIILEVTLNEKITEEHYISKLHFTWPKVSCLAGYPPRGSKVVFMSYKDQVGQIQKFAVRFLSVDETERFINFLKEIFVHERINGSTSGISKSKTSSQSEIIPSIQADIRPEWNPIASSEINSQDVYRPIQDWSPIASSAETYIQPLNSDVNYVAHPAETYIQPINSDENYVANQNSNPIESLLSQDVQGKLSAFPPSFTSLLMSCYPVDEQATQPILPEEVTLKKEIMKYLEDSSFQEMLSKVQKVVNEIGDDLLL